ncbi:MAG TPA: carboxymuconolactone decarboxylase family protein [Azoarcus sp.]|nr:carboxymuconolactone decarboxylase family protein [Azoarcus sp.]
MIKIAQGFGPDSAERLPLPKMEDLNAAQQAAVEALNHGPRQGVRGPFVPLLRAPALLNGLSKTGETLRFDSVLPKRVTEFVTLIVARHYSNQFEWSVHYPLALKMGTARESLDHLAQGRRPPSMSDEEAVAWDFSREVLENYSVSDAVYADAVERWGERGVVELTGLIGYFTCMCWIMNVARTPVQGAPEGGPLTPLPG